MIHQENKTIPFEKHANETRTWKKIRLSLKYSYGKSRFKIVRREVFKKKTSMEEDAAEPS